MCIDHFNLEAWVEVVKVGDRFAALEPIRQAVRKRFGGFRADVARGVKLRHDHGSQYMNDHFLGEIKWLGIESSPAFVGEPEGNGVAEWFNRRSTIVASQLPVEHWHGLLPDPTVADAVLDRLVHNAHKIALRGESMRKVTNHLQQIDQSAE